MTSLAAKNIENDVKMRFLAKNWPKIGKILQIFENQ
jgi:hypothetical protein